MKPGIVFLTIIFILGVVEVRGQVWIGTQFEFENKIELSADQLPSDLSHLKYCVSEGTFFYTEMRAYQRGKKDFAATIYAVRLKDHMPYQIILPLPVTVNRHDESIGKLWIYDFDITPEYAVVSTQDDIIMYHRIGEYKFEFDTIYHHHNVVAAYIFRDTLHFFEEEHDTGYKWFHRPLHDGEEKLVRELRYEAPHVVQVNPNRYLFHDTKNVFFLSTRYPILHKYDLNGDWVEDIVFDLPDWHPFEDEYIQKSLAAPYGIERIHATMNDVWRYSYPKYVFPVGGDYLLYYTQYDSITGKSRLQYAVKDASGKSHLFVKKDTCQRAYVEERFPFNLFDVNADKARISWNDLLIEVCAESGLGWAGLTPTAYQEQQNRFFKQNDPIITIRTMRYKNTRPEMAATMVDGEGTLMALSDLPFGKHVFLVNHALECSACRNVLLQLLNTLDTNLVEIGIIYDFIPGALQEREMMKDIRQYLERTFKFYYLAEERRDRGPRYYIFDNEGYDKFPGILLYETGGAPIFISANDIFEDDPNTFRFRKTFETRWMDFLRSTKQP